jgi:prolipoprotein diacylglyceryl transferase
MAGTLLGARLGHVLFYDPGYYLNHPLEILYLWEGGLASHGAVLGILLAIFLYSRFRPDESFLWICDRVGMAVPFSGCLIRLGNFFNSEILGTPSDVPWAVVFARVDAIPRHPVQLYESLSYLLVFIAQYHFFKRNHGQPPLGELFGRFFVGVFGVRFVLEFFKEEQASFALGGILTMGQWLSIPAVAAGLGCIAWSRRRETNR